MLRILAVGALAAVTSAQGPSGRLIGYTAPTSPAGTPPTLQRQVLCNPADRLCPAIGAPLAPFAGGAAYDGAHQSLWHTQGTRLVETDLETCNVRCAEPAALTLGAASLASGLTVHEATRTLYQLETIPGVAAIHEWSIRVCPITHQSACRITLPSAAHLAGAVALDARGGYVFYATSVFGAANPANTILVATLADPCNIVCRFPVDSCDPTTRLGAITGMAHDTCSGFLYVTDGVRTVELQRAGTRPCDWAPTRCCTLAPNNQEWFGLDVEPAHPRPVGTSCSGAGCPTCNDLSLVTVGDAVVGNQLFGFRIENGAAGSRAFLAFNAGFCGIHNVPFLCGPLYPDINPPMSVVPMGALIGPGPCGGTVGMPVPVPNDYGLCGGAMCFQGIVLCPNPTFPGGIALTNGVQIVVDG